MKYRQNLYLSILLIVCLCLSISNAIISSNYSKESLPTKHFFSNDNTSIVNITDKEKAKNQKNYFSYSESKKYTPYIDPHIFIDNNVFYSPGQKPNYGTSSKEYSLKNKK